MRPVGVHGPVRPRPRPGQADLVAAWLGTYALLVEGVRETPMRHMSSERHPNMMPMPSADTLAQAATQIVAMADLEDRPWFGSAGARGPIGDEDA